MERKHIPETENRLVILYTLRSLGPVTAMQLLQAMAEGDLMNYITMQLALSDMESQGQISQHAHPLGNLIEVTGEGDYIRAALKSASPPAAAPSSTRTPPPGANASPPSRWPLRSPSPSPTGAPSSTSGCWTAPPPSWT